MFEWLESILDGSWWKRDEAAAWTPPTDPLPVDTSSSIQQSNERQRQEREMEERLDAFMRAQKEADRQIDKANGEIDGFTKEDRNEALRQFNRNEELLSRQERKASLLDVEDAMFDVVSGLESNSRLVPLRKRESGVLIENDLGSGATKIEWKTPDSLDRLFLMAEDGAIGFNAVRELPSGNTGGELLWSSGTTPAWLASPASAAIMVHDGDDPYWRPIPASPGFSGAFGYEAGTGFKFAAGGWLYAYSGGFGGADKIPFADIEITGDAGFYGVEISELGAVSLAAIPEADQELPTPTANGELLYSYAGAPSWFAAPSTLALLTHDGTAPQWLAVPSSGAGLLVWDYAYGVQMPSGGGYPYAYTTGVTFSAKIPAAAIDAGSTEGFFGLAVSALGEVSVAAIPSMVEGLPTGDLGGELLYSDAGDADWLSKPASPAMLVHNATAPSWLLMPESGQGLLVWDYAYGPICHAGGGYAYAYNGSVEFKERIPASAIDATNSPEDGYYPEYDSGLGKIVWTQFPAFPDPEQELPAEGTRGELLGFGASSPYWLSAPTGAALLTHNGTDPQWLAVPSSGAGLLVWDYAYGVQMPSGGGYPYAYTTGVTFSAKIPATNIDATNPEAAALGYYPAYASDGKVTWTVFPTIPTGLPSGNTGGELLWSLGTTPTWLAAPTGAALLTHDGIDPVWFEMPAHGGGVLYYNYQGFSYADNGFIYSYQGAVTPYEKIPLGKIDAGMTEGFFGLEVSALGAVSVAAIPDPEDELPSGNTGGELLWSLGTTPTWLSAPMGAALLTHDGIDPVWFEMPANGGGVLYYNYHGFSYADHGFIYSYEGAVTPYAKIPVGKIDAGMTEGFFGLEVSALGAVSVAAIPDPEDELPSGNTGGELLWSLGTTPTWLLAPTGAALLTHDGIDPVWFEMPANGGGVLYYNYHGFSYADHGFIYSYEGAVTPYAKIPVGKIDAGMTEGFFGLEVSALGAVSVAAIPDPEDELPSGNTGGELLWSLGTTPTWLLAPTGAALLTHDGIDPVWFEMPANGGGVLYYNYHGFSYADHGFIYSYEGAVTPYAKIPVGKIDAGMTEGFFGLEVSALGAVSVAAIPDPEDELPSGNTGGELLWSLGTTPTWLLAPTGAALLTHDGIDPVWFEMPANGGGVLYYNYHGFSYADHGFIYSYEGAVTPYAKIPVGKIDAGMTEGFFGLEVSALGEVSLAAKIPATNIDASNSPEDGYYPEYDSTAGKVVWTQFPSIPTIPDPELPTTPTFNGHLLYSYDGAPSWLSVPPADETGLLWWDYRYGPAWITDATGGYPFVSKNGVAFEAKIPATNIDATNPEAAALGYYPAYASDGKVTWTVFPTIPTIPEAEDELPTPTANGQLLYSYAGDPAWLSVPPADETGLLWWDYRYGPTWITDATGGYPFVSKNGVAFEAKIPVADIYSYNDPAAGTVAHCVMLPGAPAIEWKKIESYALNATNPATAGYYLAAAADGLFTWTQFPTIPEGLPSGDTGGELLYSYNGDADWLVVPTKPAILNFFKYNPEWLEIPSGASDKSGFVTWHYQTGIGMTATGGHPYCKDGKLTFSDNIPIQHVYAYGPPPSASYYAMLEVSTTGRCTDTPIPGLTRHNFVGDGSGRYVLTFDSAGQNPELYEIGAGYV